MGWFLRVRLVTKQLQGVAVLSYRMAIFTSKPSRLLLRATQEV